MTKHHPDFIPLKNPPARSIFDVAVDLGMDPSAVIETTEREAIDFVADELSKLSEVSISDLYYAQKKDPAFDVEAENEKRATDMKIFREALRLEVLTSQLLGETEGGVLEGEFSGEGDSGDYHISTGDNAVDRFLEVMCERHVHFDWYNNDGGGGDITWYVQEDKIVINGYQNEVVKQDVMNEEEF